MIFFGRKEKYFINIFNAYFRNEYINQHEGFISH